jgi:hypothetical protein
MAGLETAFFGSIARDPEHKLLKNGNVYTMISIGSTRLQLTSPRRPGHSIRPSRITIDGDESQTKKTAGVGLGGANSSGELEAIHSRSLA